MYKIASGFQEIDIRHLVGGSGSVNVSVLRELLSRSGVVLVSERDWQVLQQYQMEASDLHQQLVQLKAEKNAKGKGD